VGVGGCWARRDGGAEAGGDKVAGLVVWERMCVCIIQVYPLWMMFEGAMLGRAVFASIGD